MSFSAGVALAERGLVPTPLVRRAIRGLCDARLAELRGGAGIDEFIAGLVDAPVAPVPERANAQHYELPARFFELVLGRHLKYSSAWWPEGVRGLDAAEQAMLDLTCERAGLADGQDILELGCGWGSLSLHMARRFSRSRITAVSNSAPQRAFIIAHGLPNLEVVTADMNRFEAGRAFDRVVSVEMFEHMRNWPALLRRVGRWLRDDGALFVHVFCHARGAYPFDVEGDDNWLGRHFFTGGIMPAFDLLPRVGRGFTLERQWWLDGTHYQRTAAAWRENLDARRGEVMDVLRAHYGADAGRWFQRWRIFFLACEELFGYGGGAEWGVGHYRLGRARGSAA
ncbi:MAG TPA: cyclopropane-fatty-acyl-phospholipid synthase family protein [Gemmatimonadales bacterium]|nr:cyclopropane-fatty-acyl-phospholipid synthase family protein [Gemmatimonadales bacterium]